MIIQLHISLTEKSAETKIEKNKEGIGFKKVYMLMDNFKFSVFKTENSRFFDQLFLLVLKVNIFCQTITIIK